MSLTNPLFNLFSMEISGRDLILFFGGTYLIWKATKEIYEEIYQNDQIQLMMKIHKVFLKTQSI